MLALTSPVETPYHRLRAGTKLGVLCVFTLALFWVTDVRVMAGVWAIVVMLTVLPGPAFARQALRMLWPLWPFVVLLLAWHWWTRDLAQGLVILMRMLAAVAAANLVTMTTRLADMMEVVERWGTPLGKIGLPPRRLALAMGLVIRFIPVLAERQASLALAWRARSAARARWRLVPALTVAALDEADQVAEALRARGGAG